VHYQRASSFGIESTTEVMVFGGMEDGESKGMWKKDVVFYILCIFEAWLQKLS
jgi:hypothetical protein